MKSLKRNLLLLLVVCCLLFPYPQTAKAQNADEQLRASVDSLRSIANSQSNTLADTVRQYFKQHSAEFDPTSPDFEKFVKTLIEEKNKLPPNRQLGLAKAVDDLKNKYDAFTNSTTDGPSAQTNPPVREPRGDSTTGRGNSNGVANSNQIGSSGQGNSTKTEGDTETSWTLSDYLGAAAGVLAALMIVGALVLSLVTLLGLRRSTDAYFTGVLPKTISGVKARQDELAKQVELASAVNKDINQRLAEVHTEIRLMSRMLQQANLATNRTANPPATYLQTPAAPVSDIPDFPIATDDLLRQMHGKSVIVKRDFQNDMLVSDPEGKGELVLIRDSQIPDDIQPLFIVPSVTQFQMRQEYYNFYEKYYECRNPEAGAVWILEPAVVEKVSGGWQLREKGSLEVR
jgi:hypothetical protein